MVFVRNKILEQHPINISQSGLDQLVREPEVINFYIGRMNALKTKHINTSSLAGRPEIILVKPDYAQFVCLLGYWCKAAALVLVYILAPSV